MGAGVSRKGCKLGLEASGPPGERDSSKALGLNPVCFLWTLTREESDGVKGLSCSVSRDSGC